jgi:hypothetical protein
MIKLLNQDPFIINIDETWIAKTDFRCRKWLIPGTTNSMPNPLINPRINLLAAVSSNFHLYYSISQGNTNKESFSSFMYYLAFKLDQNLQNWRKNTIVILDGAKYHISVKSRNQMKKLGFSIIFSGPHSYDAASCEHLFAQLNNSDLNPLTEKTSKR